MSRDEYFFGVKLLYIMYQLGLMNGSEYRSLHEYFKNAHYKKA